MLEDAAHRFAVVGVVKPIYNKNIIIWQITLHAVTKEAAQESDGDMIAEDYEQMKAAIDADCERLTEVQNSLIWIAAHRHEIEIELETANREWQTEFFNERMMYAEEQKERADEEVELRRDLEDAGILVSTTEERAKERLEAIHARRAEIAEADQKTRVFEDLDGEDEILEMELSA